MCVYLTILVVVYIQNVYIFALYFEFEELLVNRAKSCFTCNDVPHVCDECTTAILQTYLDAL